MNIYKIAYKYKEEGKSREHVEYTELNGESEEDALVLLDSILEHDPVERTEIISINKIGQDINIQLTEQEYQEIGNGETLTTEFNGTLIHIYKEKDLAF